MIMSLVLDNMMGTCGYRKLNSVDKPDAELLPRINMLSEALETNKHTIATNLWTSFWK